MKKKLKAAFIGECMVELRRENGLLTQTYGGDAFNCGVYLKRASGADVDFISALGKDPYSDGMAAFWKENGINADLTQRLDNKLPGLYIIEVDTNGERSFLYWRGEAAAKFCFDTPESDNILASLWSYDLVHLSGISLAILTPEGREKLLAALEKIAQRGVPISFDFNYRTKLWGNYANAAPYYKRLAKIAKWIFLSPDEIQAAGYDLSDPANPDYKKAIEELGAEWTIVKNEDKPCLVYNRDGSVIEVHSPKHLNPVDTTAAGDSFIGAYLAAATNGKGPEECVEAAQKMASAVIMQRGAIISEKDTPKLFYQ